MKAANWLRNLIDVRPEERAAAALMSLYFFLVITSFWILKPIKKTLFIDHFATDGLSILGSSFTAPEAEQLAKVGNLFVAAIAATVFSALSRSLRRAQLTTVFAGFFLAAYAFFAIVGPAQSGLTVSGFYLMGDLFSTLMVATFFSFLNDSVSPDSAKRLYGVVGFGGVLGGVFGSTAVALWISALSTTSWLAIAAGLAIAIVIVARAAAAKFKLDEDASQVGVPVEATPEAAPTSDAVNPAIAGARLVFRSGYLMSIVAIVGLYELVSAIVDFQFTSAIFEFTQSEAERSQHYASVFAVTNWVSMFVQLFLTSFIMRRFGLSVALLLLPVSIALSSIGFLAAPTLLLGSLLSVSDNGLSYSVNQSSKEALYVPTTVEEKYQAKAFIDMFVQRAAKVVGVGIGLTVKNSFVGVAGVSSLSFAVLPLVGLWAYAAVYAGRAFRQREEESGGSPP